ncbi:MULTISPECIES: glutamine--fructose-6-phosphate transaminase (isomerizing) [Empedobacter]|uniref:Glutamine--fructose-6-phosphate aminotransferase [isomerizing] n=1 Tax=Empedobacter falsenii TaxID=343874 RepID=A0A7H9DWZ8_9FLAO|nr:MULTISPECIES: glutamine--fructose-6-phosphate transaminase (isomerizing) [Empedobacter]MDH2207333.1 glutamine--fructose-6-phosphate transaminase (isomerizing) [Empedobacter sp. GD03644]MDM1547802.1 glutamine--fructose-6-phosphate transaminase (isomerizing) [Empedobacter falsenii]QLL59722.1 glutamine--fructose-6-phosphate transaminase (isomerizing) [Empedobacter falsenii]
MCGIVGYIGHREAYPIIINGLKRLEYRGYDSAGLVLSTGTDFELVKTKGKVSDLEDKSANLDKTPHLGIGHTRWATHGVPNDVNSHPHMSNNGRLVLVHNGIIENYESIKQLLKDKGYVFHSDTDTEVLVNFIQLFQEEQNLNLTDAVRLALNEVIGAYAIAVLDKEEANTIVVGRLGSPLAIGIGENEFFVASDASPFIEFTKDAVYLEDGDMATITLDKEVDVRTIQNNEAVSLDVQELQLNIEAIEKGGYEHFMLKEINEQPRSIRDTMRGRLLVDEGVIKMAGIWDHQEKFLNAKRIIIVACGTSYHAGLVAEYMIEDFARIPVEVEYASEFRYRNPIINKHDVVIAISQSGETADTLAALKLAKEAGAFIFGINNVVGSSIARITDAGAYTHAGPEIGVASTKAFTAQLTILALIALKLGKHNGELSTEKFTLLTRELERIPDLVQQILDNCEGVVDQIAEKYKDNRNAIYLGRGYNYPSALEGALKLKEISYIHAEGYPAAEMKHGPIALLDENMPVIVIATKKGYYEKVVSNIQEIKSRSAKVIAIVNDGDEQVTAMADDYVVIPETAEEFSPILTAIPLQLLSYWIAVKLGKNVDQPRNLAKSVTVE